MFANALKAINIIPISPTRAATPVQSISLRFAAIPSIKSLKADPNSLNVGSVPSLKSLVRSPRPLKLFPIVPIAFSNPSKIVCLSTKFLIASPIVPRASLSVGSFNLPSKRSSISFTNFSNPGMRKSLPRVSIRLSTFFLKSSRELTPNLPPIFLPKSTAASDTRLNALLINSVSFLAVSCSFM